jgi:DNA (cytosine-5)-methyltransferase 1
METPAMALQRLGVSVDHAFACDVNNKARMTIMANFPPRVFYDDLTTRENATAPKVDLYVAGFPCQPFSSEGLQQGFGDKAGRGTIFFRVREYIEAQEPKVFVLENVSGLLTVNGGQYFKAILESLEALGTYNIYHQLLDTKQHGVPQSRRRIYIVGIKRTCDKNIFQFPEPVELPSIENFLEPRTSRPTAAQLPPRTNTTARTNVMRALKDVRSKGHDPLTEAWIVDCDSSPGRAKWVRGISPCFTCSRGSGHWITNRGRRMTKTEMLRLQGMNTEAEGFKVVVPPTHLGRQLGNAMSCNVLERLFVRLLPAAGLVTENSLRDKWEPTVAAPSTPQPKETARRLKRHLSGESPPKRVPFKRFASGVLLPPAKRSAKCV